MGLDVNIIMCRNRKQLLDEHFWDNCPSGWQKDIYGEIDFSKPCQVYYARKFWRLYTPMCRRLQLENGEYSQPLTKDDIEDMIMIATHERDYFDSFNTIPALCEILDNYDQATDAGMVFIFEGDF